MEPERCAECGFDATLLTTADAITALRSLGRRWREAFEDVPDEILRRRPAPDVWSPLEYGAHTRDVLALIGHGVDEILNDTHPTFPVIEPEPDAPDHGYNALDPDRVLSKLADNAAVMADRAARALPQHWSRTATIGGDEVDAGWLLRHAVHDATHHLRDVQKILGHA
jgi:DinB family protein